MTEAPGTQHDRPRSPYQIYLAFCWQVDTTVSRLSDLLWGVAMGVMAVPAVHHEWSRGMKAGLGLWAVAVLLSCWQRWHRFPLWLAREQVRRARGDDEPTIQESLCP